MFNLDRFIDKPVDVKAIIDRLEFDPDEVEKAAVEQPRMLLEASRFKLQCFDRKQKRSRICDTKMAKAKIRLRERSRSGTAKNKLTESAISDMTVIDPAVRLARRRMERAIKHDEFGKMLLDIMRARDHAVNVVNTARNAEMFNQLRDVKSKLAVEGMRKAASKARERYSSMDED